MKIALRIPEPATVDRQWGECGVCGDAYDLPSPRPHEAGGLYSTGVISRTYTQADVINVTVDITANHMGYFTFKLCPNNNFEKEATQTCLDSFVLQVVDASGQVSGERHYIDNTVGFKHVRLQLPEDVTCTQCVLQWTYNTGNSWGCGDNGCCIGCGPQEQFVNCVDIAITARGDSGSNIHTTTDSTVTQAASTVTNTKASRGRTHVRLSPAFLSEAAPEASERLTELLPGEGVDERVNDDSEVGQHQCHQVSGLQLQGVLLHHL
ncbi:hypothetical protein C0Q70_11943 [Pomacea canaliculata]|uniref:Chitin-binding type-4 domain-containing protein n=1 Tax=Pomacea canaliculata TaxID=400727 RepID=A0A2T7P7D5_POMCA|nr:hypothetical protein C0Q70_11943 [Pomacea canaliculata]